MKRFILSIFICLIATTAFGMNSTLLDLSTTLNVLQSNISNQPYTPQAPPAAPSTPHSSTSVPNLAQTKTALNTINRYLSCDSEGVVLAKKAVSQDEWNALLKTIENAQKARITEFTFDEATKTIQLDVLKVFINSKINEGPQAPPSTPQPSVAEVEKNLSELLGQYLTVDDAGKLLIKSGASTFTQAHSNSLLDKIKNAEKAGAVSIFLTSDDSKNHSAMPSLPINIPLNDISTFITTHTDGGPPQPPASAASSEKEALAQEIIDLIKNETDQASFEENFKKYMEKLCYIYNGMYLNSNAVYIAESSAKRESPPALASEFKKAVLVKDPTWLENEIEFGVANANTPRKMSIKDWVTKHSYLKKLSS